MKHVFTRMLLVLVAAIGLSTSVLAGPAEAKTPSFDHRVATRNLIANLKSENAGIVEGTLFVIVQYKNRFPDLDYSTMIDATEKLARDEKDLSLSYKAHLTTLYLRYGSEKELVPTADPFDYQSLFKQVAEELETRALASNLSR